MILSVVFAVAVAAGPADLSAATVRREPVALAFSPGGTRLVVANRRSGGLSVIDPKRGAVLGEYKVGQGLADLSSMADGRWLAVDQADDALLLVEVDDDGARLLDRLPVSPGPVALHWHEAGRVGVVTSLESRTLTVFKVDGDRLVAERTVGIPFSPRRVVTLERGTRAVVADAFGGTLAVVDTVAGSVLSVLSLPAKNVRGMAVAPDGRSIVVAHQVLNKDSRTDFEGVHWGRLLNNHLRTLRASSVLTATSEAGLLEGGLVTDLGSFGDAAGDPAGLAFGPSEDVAVALSGVGEVAFGPHPMDIRRRVAVGRRPVAVAFSPDGRTLYSADALDDSVTAIDLPVGLWRKTISLGPRPEPDAVARGERLFFDARLSHDGWMSCQSCHADGGTAGGLADTLGDGDYGTPKLVPSLLGVAETGPWGWTGSITRLEDQVRQSVVSTMQGPPPTDHEVNDLTAYLRSLAPPRASAGGTAAVRGEAVFAARKCDACHAPPTYTSVGTRNVGLSDENGRRSFNPPSLRGVGDRLPFLHDGRAGSLREVFSKYRHPRDSAWGDAEVDDLVAFLKTL